MPSPLIFDDLYLHFVLCSKNCVKLTLTLHAYFYQSNKTCDQFNKIRNRDCTKTVTWLFNLCDNKITLQITLNLTFHNHINHIEIDYYSLMQEVQLKPTMLVRSKV